MKSFLEILYEDDAGGIANTTASVDGLRTEPLISKWNQRKYQRRNTRLAKLLRRNMSASRKPTQPNIPLLRATPVASMAGIQPEHK